MREIKNKIKINQINQMGSTKGNDKPLMESIQKPRMRELKKKPLCTFGVLRDYYRKHHFYPGSGRWNLSDYQSDPEQGLWNLSIFSWQPTESRWKSSNQKPLFDLDACTFRHRIFPRAELAKCLIAANVSSVAMFGDSNGRRFNSALVDFVDRIDLREAGTCVRQAVERTRHKGFEPDSEYFTRNEPWGPFLEIQNRTCRTCLSEKKTCNVTSGGTTRAVHIENVHQDAIIDISLRLNHSPWLASTTQQFMMKYFLAGRYPDILMLFLPLHHAIEKDFNVSLKQLRLFRDIVKKHVPRHTKVFFLPAHTVFKYTVHSETVRRLNHALYDMMETDMLNPAANIYGFIDLLDISIPRTDWRDHGDIMHMTKDWYQTVISMFLETYCNSVTLHQW